MPNHLAPGLLNCPEEGEAGEGEKHQRRWDTKVAHFVVTISGSDICETTKLHRDLSERVGGVTLDSLLRSDDGTAKGERR